MGINKAENNIISNDSNHGDNFLSNDDREIDFSSILQNVTNKQTRREVENRAINYQKRNIILPSNLYEVTKQLANHPNEIRGVLLAQKQVIEDKIFYIVKFIELLGQGTEYKVNINEKKMNSMLELLRRHKDLNVIEFHTHTRATGADWEDKFSDQDYKAIGKTLMNNQEYIHVLFTPTHILSVGKSKVTFNLAEDNEKINKGIMKGYENLKAEFDEIMRNG